MSKYFSIYCTLAPGLFHHLSVFYIPSLGHFTNKHPHPYSTHLFNSICTPHIVHICSTLCVLHYVQVTMSNTDNSSVFPTISLGLFNPSLGLFKPFLGLSHISLGLFTHSHLLHSHKTLCSTLNPGATHCSDRLPGLPSYDSRSILHHIPVYFHTSSRSTQSYITLITTPHPPQTPRST